MDFTGKVALVTGGTHGIGFAIALELLREGAAVVVSGLPADVDAGIEAFTEAGGPWDPAVAKRLKENVFSVGNTIDPADGYRAFRGRDPSTGALMRKRGFEPAGE